ncbi:MAG: hypothetical protein RIB58_14295 [Phycisphaerales bacterium]|jgi:hypothetical protein
MPTTATSPTRPTATDLPTLLAELRRTRARAEGLLAELRQAQRESEERMASKPGGDTYKRVAGASSLENAARDAERVIAAIDRRLRELASGSDLSTSMADWVRGR